MAAAAALALVLSPGKAYATTYWLFDNASSHGVSSGYCLNDPNNSTTNGTQMQLFGCNFTGGFGNAHGEENIQIVDGTPYGWSGWDQLKLQNGKCLDATLGGGNGVKLQIWTCMPFGQDFNQIWGPITWSGSGSAGAWGVYSAGGCIDNTNDAHVNHNPIQTWACGNPPDNAQSWNIESSG